jgi:hypothetical protein
MDGNKLPYLGILAGWHDPVRDDSYSDGLPVDGIQTKSVPRPSSPETAMTVTIRLPVKMLLVADDITVFQETASTQPEFYTALAHGYVPAIWLWELSIDQFEQQIVDFVIG